MNTTDIFFAKFAASAFVAIIPAAPWLPEDPVGATIIGLVGGALRWSVSRAQWTEGAITICTGVGTAVFGNGIEIPGLASIVDANALWRVNTLLLAFIGVSILEAILLVKNKLASKGD